MIFSLAPHDINDLIALYENAGQITEAEQDIIVSNPRGHAFFMTGPYARTRMEVVVTPNIVKMFDKIRTGDSDIVYVDDENEDEVDAAQNAIKADEGDETPIGDGNSNK